MNRPGLVSEQDWGLEILQEIKKKGGKTTSKFLTSNCPLLPIIYKTPLILKKSSSSEEDDKKMPAVLHGVKEDSENIKKRSRSLTQDKKRSIKRKKDIDHQKLWLEYSAFMNANLEKKGTIMNHLCLSFRGLCIWL